MVMEAPRPQVPPVEDAYRVELPPLVWIDRFGNAVAVEPLGHFVDEAKEERRRHASQRDYSDYEKRAIRYMVRHRALAPDEQNDVRFFQCRACGFNPNYKTPDGQMPIRKWFWAKHEETRKELVRLSRTIRVRFFRGRRNIISTEVSILA